MVTLVTTFFLYINYDGTMERLNIPHFFLAMTTRHSKRYICGAVTTYTLLCRIFKNADCFASPVASKPCEFLLF